jgi:hypothetical protein
MPAPKTHCIRGHVYDEENTYIDPKGHRYCRKCKAEQIARARAEGRVPMSGTSAKSIREDSDDPYARGWEAGYRQALADVRAGRAAAVR